MQKVTIFGSCWELNPRWSAPVTTLDGMASVSAARASITMATPNRNYELKKPQLFIEFFCILFITVKSSEYRKSFFFFKDIQVAAPSTLLLLWAAAPLSHSCCPSYTSDYTDYAIPALTGQHIITKMGESRYML